MKPRSLRWWCAFARLRAAQMLDRPAGALAWFGCSAVAGAAFVWFGIASMASEKDSQTEPMKAAINVFIYIGIMIISALISYALRPKVEQPEAIKGNAPVAEDGKSILRLYGEGWFTDVTMLGWKDLGTVKIKAKGGKK